MPNKWMEQLTKHLTEKKLLMPVALGLAGILLLLLSSGFMGEDQKKADTSEPFLLSDYKAAAEKELSNLLLSIDEVEKVRVLISYADTGKKVYSYNENNDVSTDQEQESRRNNRTLAMERKNGDEIPVIQKELHPEIKGVTIIADCTGGENTKYRIYQAVKASAGAPPHAIEIIINDRSR